MAQSQQTLIERAWHRLEFWALIAILCYMLIFAVAKAVDPIAAEAMLFPFDILEGLLRAIGSA
jgi:hypothetical protein